MSTSRERKRQKRHHSTREYIDMRIGQLKEDRLKASNPHDVLWYDRLIDELTYVQMVDQNRSMGVQ